ncbi:SGNH/GDSL hydrolase family protein [Histidinibacterium aquaticum]|uniref:SGNH/GDSL hydrolase family protein n=1 Tax=Histidinibacterium aquaticum TaxID=2613962 RepID=A0A5J5GD58_9RHOB|nr:SGNH/GDSL hydrolase family protein [Histidinibacterium aquaticum]KAA9006001.1 SGNH/GDSL hydrolase family protein [Histidinibacterium aquaticum]
MPTLLAFGDSNTHGTPPIETRGEYRRYGRADRWPGACSAALGPDWEVIEEGLPGRTACHPDPIMGAHMDARPALRTALESHGPLDVLVLMLGTNDAKTRFAPSADRIVAGIAGLCDHALGPDMQVRHGGFSMLLVCPPLVREVGPVSMEFIGAERVMAGLPAELLSYAERRGAGYFDANSVIEVSPVDGIHFDESAHRRLGEAIAGAVLGLV